MPRVHVLLTIAVTISCLTQACSLKHVPNQAGPTHSGTGACITCHRTTDPSTSGNSSTFAGGIDPSAACLDCHHYTVNHHPVNVVPRGEYMRRSTDMLPLFEGQVRCLTCHQAHSDAGCGNFKGAPALLRGGPYEDVRALCFICHFEERYAEIDPHKMLDDDGGIRTVDGAVVCLMCHTTKPDPLGDPEAVEFKADVAFLCLRCHAPMAGTFLGKHLHIKPGKKVRSQMKTLERKTGIILPLAVDDMITCSTCHNPHQEGVILPNAAGAGADATRRLRIAKEDICKACHTQ